jgi:HNH endonuclease
MPTHVFARVKSQVPVIEQALETAALALGTEKSRGYCLEMICADFLAGANLEDGDPNALVSSVRRLIELLPEPQWRQILNQEGCALGSAMAQTKRKRLRPELYQELRLEILRRDRWTCQFCGAHRDLQVHHFQSKGCQGDDAENNLVTLCAACHQTVHRFP